jgi:type VII secretion-associated serine protease mycosin
VTDRRTILALGIALAVSIGVASPAAAEPGSDPQEAAAIVATAPRGEPVTVVTTTQTPDGPQFTTTVADSRREALDIVSSALDDSGVDAVDVAHPVSIAATSRRANDTYRDQQWALNQLRAEKVWHKSAGKGVVVAVLDTGVRSNHPDLRGNVLKGWDFVASDNQANDANGHGTHVAGVIAARRDNRKGIAGLASSAKILPVRVLNGAGNGNTVTVARGIRYAVRKGADVINLSLAGVDSDAQLRAAVAYAVKKNVVVVAAAGNAGCGAPTSYPAAYPNVIGVGAIDRYRNVAPYSNCGSYVDVVAPGTGIISTTTYRPHPGLGCSYGVNYCRLSGTSMATPYAAASAAVLISRTKHRLRASKIRALMTTKADDIGPRGRDAGSGRGIIDPRRMMAGR